MTKQIALVTGGMGGLGEAISIRLHDAGYTVVVTHSPAVREAPEFSPGSRAWTPQAS